MTTEPLDGERADLLAALDRARKLLRRTLRGLSDEQACQRTTVSALCLGGVVKHVTKVERYWARFIVEGAEATSRSDDAAEDSPSQGFELTEGETMAGLLQDYQQVADATDQLVATFPDLSQSHPLPEALWFAPGTSWSVRRTLFHLVAETAQHAGHADIIRESLDGAKSMG